MAAITGAVVVILTVTDVERSAAWYAELLGMREAGRYVDPDGRVGQVCLAEPRCACKSASSATMPAGRSTSTASDSTTLSSSSRVGSTWTTGPHTWTHSASATPV